MHQEPDVGFDPGSPESRPGPKAGAKPLRHPGIPLSFSFYSLFPSFFLYSFSFFSFLSFFLSSLFILFPIQFVFGHTALSKMTRRKTLPQRKNQKQASLPQSYKIWITIQCQKANSEALLYSYWWL